MGIGPTTFLAPLRCSYHWAARASGERGRLTTVSARSVPLVLRVSTMWFPFRVRPAFWSSLTSPTSAKVWGLSLSWSKYDLRVFLWLLRFSSLSKIDSQQNTSGWGCAPGSNMGRITAAMQERLSYAFGPILLSCVALLSIQRDVWTNHGMTLNNIVLSKLNVFRVKRTLPWPPNKLSHLTTTCKYVNSTNNATLFNLQQCYICKQAWLSIKFSHPVRRINWKKNFVRWPP